MNKWDLKVQSFFNFIGLKRYHLVIAFWFILFFLLFSIVVTVINFNKFGTELIFSYFLFLSSLIVVTSLLGLYLFKNSSIWKNKTSHIGREKIARQLKIATACFAAYLGIAIIIGGFEGVLIVEGVIEENVNYSAAYLVYGYPVVAVLLWPLFSRKLK